MKKLLIVIDFQKDFIDGSLGFKDAVKLREIIQNKIENYLRNHDDLIYTMDTHDKNYLESFEGQRLPVEHCLKNSDGWKIDKSCDFSSKAIKVFEKNTFPSLELANYLKDGFYDEIELCGLVSHICVLSNAIMVKSALPNAHIFIDAKATSSFDLVTQEKCFDVLNGLHIDVINR